MANFVSHKAAIHIEFLRNIFLAAGLKLQYYIVKNRIGNSHQICTARNLAVHSTSIGGTMTKAHLYTSNVIGLEFTDRGQA
jgi:hypothetical protein